MLLGGVLSSQVPSATQLAVLSREGRRTLPTLTVGGQQLIALDDLAATFQLSVREEALGNITVSYKGKTIVLTPDQSLASVAGRLVSLPAPPTRSGRRWMVPVEFVSRALAPIYDSRLDLRKGSQLLIVGDLRVPRIAVRYEPLGNAGRLTIDATPRTASTVTQDNEHLTVRFDADAIDPATPLLPPQLATSLVQNVRLVDAVTIGVDLAPRTTVRAVSQPAETSTRLTIDVSAAPTSDQQTPPPAAPPPGPPRRCRLPSPRHPGCAPSRSIPGTAAKTKASKVPAERKRRMSR